MRGNASASAAIAAGGGVEALVKLLEGGPVSEGALAAVACLTALVTGNRCAPVPGACFTDPTAGE